MRSEGLSRALSAGLEDGAGWEGCAHDPGGQPEQRIQLSIAISLKRIADALQPTNDSGMNSIPESLHGIMLNGPGR